MTPRFEFFDHTADIGVRVYAPTLAELVPPATEGFYATIGELVLTPNAGPREFNLYGDDAGLLLRDYLAELLHLFETEHRGVRDVAVREYAGGRLWVVAQAHEVDRAKSVLLREVKAVTYHELAVRRTPDGYEATFVVDI